MMFIMKLLLWSVVILLLIHFTKKVTQFLILIYYVFKLPAPPRYNFLLGNAMNLTTDPVTIHKVLRQWAKDYYPIYNGWIGGIGAANILSPEDFELLSSNMAHIKKGDMYLLLEQWLKTGLLTSYGDKWQARRKLLTPAFHFSILQEIVTIFNTATEEFVNLLKQSECGSAFTEVNSYISDFTLKTIVETSMGAKFDLKSEKGRSYKHAVYKMTQVLLAEVFKPWLHFTITFYIASALSPTKRALLNILHGFTKGVINNREKEFDADQSNKLQTPKRRLAMLDLLLKAKKDGLIDGAGIREEVDTFMFEGHDTVSTSICFTLMLLANHKEAQERIREEMYEVLRGDLNQSPSYNDLQEMKYLERCIKESLRLYPSVYFIARTLGEDLFTHSGYLLKKDTMTFVHIYDIHHNPDIYPDPEKFDPDRFLPENSAKRHPFAYVPFSAGPRNCIGQRFAILEMKAFLCGVLSNFILEPVDTQTSVVLISDIILRSRDPIKVRFVQRENQ